MFYVHEETRFRKLHMNPGLEQQGDGSCLTCKKRDKRAYYINTSVCEISDVIIKMCYD